MAFLLMLGVWQIASAEIAMAVDNSPAVTVLSEYLTPQQLTPALQGLLGLVLFLLIRLTRIALTPLVRWQRARAFAKKRAAFLAALDEMVQSGSLKGFMYWYCTTVPPMLSRDKATAEIVFQATDKIAWHIKELIASSPLAHLDTDIVALREFVQTVTALEHAKRREELDELKHTFFTQALALAEVLKTRLEEAFDFTDAYSAMLDTMEALNVALYELSRTLKEAETEAPRHVPQLLEGIGKCMQAKMLASPSMQAVTFVEQCPFLTMDDALEKALFAKHDLMETDLLFYLIGKSREQTGAPAYVMRLREPKQFDVLFKKFYDPNRPYYLLNLAFVANPLSPLVLSDHAEQLSNAIKAHANNKAALQFILELDGVSNVLPLDTRQKIQARISAL